MGTTTSRPDHDHAHGHPTGQPAPITSGSAAPITNEGAAQQEVDLARLKEEVAAYLLLGSAATGRDGLPLVRAKVHLFLRGIPRLTRCVAPAEHVLVDGQTVCPHPECDEAVAFPVAVCKGCGQDYDIVAKAREAEGSEGGEPVPLAYVARRLHHDPPDGVAEDDETLDAGARPVLRAARRCPR